MGNRRVVDVEIRFWSRVCVGDGCWLWTGALNNVGYGQFSVRCRHVLAHRMSWTLECGPIPAGLWALHDCPGGDNPACVRPSHLFLGTRADNMADMVAKDRQARLKGEAAPRAKLTEAQVLGIRARAAAGEPHRKLGREFAVDYSTISDIVRRKSWAHLECGDA